MFNRVLRTERATGGVLQENVFLELRKTSQNSEETPMPVSFLIKLQA